MVGYLLYISGDLSLGILSSFNSSCSRKEKQYQKQKGGKKKRWREIKVKDLHRKCEDFVMKYRINNFKEARNQKYK